MEGCCVVMDEGCELGGLIMGCWAAVRVRAGKSAVGGERPLGRCKWRQMKTS